MPETQDRPLSVLQHLEELRRRLMMCLGMVALASAVCFGLSDRLIDWLKRPAGSALTRLAFFGPTEAFGASFAVALTFGIALSLPLILYEGWAFVRPGLTSRERSYGFVVVGWGSVLFALGAACAYYVFLPVFLQFLLAFGQPYLEPVISIGRYLAFVLGVMVACGVVFELPLAVFVLTKTGLLTPAFLRHYRKAACVGLLIVAAFLTPTTDVLSLLLMTVPLLALYEVAIVVSRLTSSRQR